MAELKEILKLRSLLDEYNIDYVYRKYNYDYENAETIEIYNQEIEPEFVVMEEMRDYLYLINYVIENGVRTVRESTSYSGQTAEQVFERLKNEYYVTAYDNVAKLADRLAKAYIPHCVECKDTQIWLYYPNFVTPKFNIMAKQGKAETFVVDYDKMESHYIFKDSQYDGLYGVINQYYKSKLNKEKGYE